jgi:hypothetical protein
LDPQNEAAVALLPSPCTYIIHVITFQSVRNPPLSREELILAFARRTHYDMSIIFCDDAHFVLLSRCLISFPLSSSSLVCLATSVAFLSPGPHGDCYDFLSFLVIHLEVLSIRFVYLILLTPNVPLLNTHFPLQCHDHCVFPSFASLSVVFSLRRLSFL